MATSLGNTVHPHAFAGDPLWIQLTADPYVSNGAAAEHTITFNEPTTAGDTIVLVIAGVAITFTCAASPDDSGLQYNDGGSTTSAASNFEDALLAHFDVTEHYTVSRITNVITLTSRLSGAIYDVSATFDPPTRGTLAVVQAGVDPELKPNYAIGLRLWIATVPDPVVLSRSPGEGGSVEFPIQSILWDAMRNATWPPVGLANGQGLDWNLIGWRAEFYEIYGDPATPKVLHAIGTENSPRVAWYASMRQELRGSTQDFLDECTGNATKKHPFLTWRGREAKRYVTREEQHVLGWYHWIATENYDDIVLRAKVYFANGLSSAVTDIYTNSDFLIEEGFMGQFAVGWTELGLDSLVPPGDVPVKYEVFLFGMVGNDPISETKTFYLRDSDHNDLYIQFQNSLGIVESMPCKGAWELGAEAEHELLQRTLTSQSPHTDNAQVQEPNGTQQTLQVSSGYVKRYELYALLDILHSKEVKWFDRERNVLIGLTLNKPKARIVSRGAADELLFALNLEFNVGDRTMAFSLPATVIA